MLINPGAQQRVAGFEAQEEGGKKARKEWRNFCFVLFSVSLWQFFPFPCESLGGAREESEWRGCWRGWNRVCSWVCVPVKVCPSPWEEVGRRSPDLPQVALDMEISSKIEHKMVFIAFSSPKKKKKRKDFFSFLLAPGRNGLFCTRSKYTKHRFLVKSATGGKKSNIAGAQRICCACEIILLTISLGLASCLWLRIKTVILECTAGSNLWPSSLLS